ncbi:hypothetical protein [Cohnella soli]|uniref:Restriction endonuclease domain-containing protein n=1 Tax=Cohnella soli TaxID=425005 RepID=A0ABW0HQB8_9BACL
MPAKVELTGDVQSVRKFAHPEIKNMYWTCLEVLDDAGTYNALDNLPIPEALTYTVLLNDKLMHIVSNQLQIANTELVGSKIFIGGRPIINLPPGVLGRGSIALVAHFARSEAQPAEYTNAMKDTKIFWPIDKLVVPDEFKAHVPKQEKIQAALSYYYENGEMEKPVLVQVNDDGTGTMKDGYVRYIASLQIEREQIWVVGEGVEQLYQTDADEIAEDGTQKKMWPLESIVIPEGFKPPREEKILSAMAYYEENGQMEKPIEIIVLPEGIVQLRDGLARYYAYQRLGIKKAWIIY